MFLQTRFLHHTKISAANFLVLLRGKCSLGMCYIKYDITWGTLYSLAEATPKKGEGEERNLSTFALTGVLQIYYFS